ncbi:putative iron-regulated membrane protein [Nitrosospira multiformis]|uniref:Putative iron-regulated membrane protein n=1 Tax=Nitrosospira multiformis TaxID=1231 RepID=A0A2T5IE00_9PROT|nr:PepSY-associated TM helix domain-containing protein [Nitrosospira multiformis]PTQ82057.1 putative iron-regulated membrane protein [Nitrosospira multiformis]
MRTRRVVFNIHLYIGLAAGLFLILSGLTGSMVVFRDEIEALTHPELMETAVGEEHVPVQAVLDAVKRAYPEDKLLYLRMPRTPQETYLFKMNSAHDLFVYADPYSGEVLGAHRQKETFMGWIALVHTELLVGELGKNILGVSALLLICLCGTGLFLWWPPNGIRNISRGFKIGWTGPWKKFIFDVHRAFGAYTIIFLIIVAFTGVSLVFNKAVAELINSLTASAPRPSPPNSRVNEAVDSMSSLDALLYHADRILPAPTTWITFPQTPQAPLVVRKRTTGEFHPNGRSFVYFDQYSGDVLLVENASNAPLGARIFNTFYPIHTGVIGGLATRMLQVVMGFVPLFLFATGYMMWRNRRKARLHKNNSKVAY